MNRTGENWDVNTYNKKLDMMITNAFKKVFEKYKKIKTEKMRNVSYMIAIERVVNAMKLRGR